MGGEEIGQAEAEAILSDLDLCLGGACLRAVYVYPAALRRSKGELSLLLEKAGAVFTPRSLPLREVLSIETDEAIAMDALAGEIARAGARVVFAFKDAFSGRFENGLREALPKSGIYFRLVSPSEASKRSLALELIAEMTLIDPGL